MALPLLGLFIMAIAVITFFRKRSDRRQQDTNKTFWEREQQSNLVRRQDISGLSYISIPFEDFSIGAFSDDELIAAEQALKALCDKKILNLTGKTNTDLKFLYGPANLPTLIECDQNFTDMLHVLTDYSNRLIELEHLDAAIPVLEFCVNVGSDISAHYTTLAHYYKANSQTAKLDKLHEKASALESLNKASILQKLNTIITE